MRTSRIVKVGVVVGLAAAILSGCHVGGDAFKAKFIRSEELTAPLDGITEMDVNIEVGKIHLEAADVAEVRIEAEIRVRAATEEKARDLAEQVRIAAEPSGHILAIKAIKPSGFGRNELSVDLAITAPAGLALQCTTNVGDIRTLGFTNSVRAQTSVGAIVCTGLRSDIDLRTNVGDIRAEYAPDAPAAIRVDASANVGAIELAGPQEISAGLTAQANVGSIDTDRPITVTGHLKQSIRASLGSAEGRISLRTNVGSIHIR